MPTSGPPSRFAADARAAVGRDERLILLSLLLLSLAALAVFLHYTTLILGGLPDVIPSVIPGP